MHPGLQPLNIATGYCELGMWQEALDELDALTAEARGYQDVLGLRLQILVGLQQWEPAAALAKSLIARGCRDRAAFLLGAYAIRRLRSAAEAKEFLLRGEAMLCEVASFHFHLACYECQLGEIPLARGRLATALELDPALRVKALEDEDLAPLWQ